MLLTSILLFTQYSNLAILLVTFFGMVIRDPFKGYIPAIQCPIFVHFRAAPGSEQKVLRFRSPKCEWMGPGTKAMVLKLGNWVFPKMVGFPPTSSILIGFSIKNHPFWGTPIFGNNQLLIKVDPTKSRKFALFLFFGWFFHSSKKIATPFWCRVVSPKSSLRSWIYWFWLLTKRYWIDGFIDLN